MKGISKYDGIILDGRWKYKGIENKSLRVFENIFNHTEVKLSDRQVKDVLDGHTTVSAIMCRRIKKSNVMLPNKIADGYKNLKHRYALASRRS